MNKILIVDNSDIIRNVLKDLFKEKNNFLIFEAKNFKEIQELTSEHSFFACISKIELADSLKAEHFHLFLQKQIPTIILTTKNDAEITSLTSMPNIINYVQKDSLHGLELAYDIVELMAFLEEQEVLVVDDSMVVLAQIEAILNSLLLKVHLAKNGKEALDILNDNPHIALMITDYNMSEMVGLELISTVKKKKEFSSLPILVMTSYNDSSLKIKLYNKGASDFLVKPILPEELKSKIVSLFSNIKQINEIKQFYKIFDDNVISSTTDENGVITNVSKAFCEVAGYSKEELIGKPHNIIRHPDMPSSVFKQMWETIQEGKQWSGEVKNIKKDGSFYWVNVVIEPIFNKTSKIKGYTSIRQDITDKKIIYQLSITDSLTSLYNRRHFNEIANQMLTDTVRNNEFLSLIILDIDNFKKYNDTYGHLAGDEVLVEISKCLKNSFKRITDMIFRLGGEEFGVLFFVKNKEDIEELVNKARIDIHNLQIEHSKNSDGVVTVSMGVSVIDLKKKNYKLDEIYIKTDEALYEAKNSGRNKTIIVEM